MTLYYKFWRETRVRWGISMAVLAWACVVIVLFQKEFRARADEPTTFASYVWEVVYKGTIRDLFIVLTIGLGLGGLLQERKHGTVGFTLALPASRARLVAVRAIVGFAELAGLALVPALTIPLLSPLVSETYPLAQALQFGVLWVGGGVLVFAVAILLSALLAGEYSAWIISFVWLTLYSLLVNIPALKGFPSLDIFKIMNGRDMTYFQFADHILIGPLPWVTLLVLGLISAGLVIATSQVVERQDF